MPLPTWLPPLQINHGNSVHVAIEQCQPPPISHSSGFMINVNVSETYVCQDPRVSTTRLKSLSLSKSFHIPLDCLGASWPSSLDFSKSVIMNMLDHVPLPFRIERFYWRTSRLNGFVSSNQLFGRRDISGFILRYLVELRESSGQSQSQGQPVGIQLTIDRETIIPNEVFQVWISWYDVQRRLSPTFEADYAEAMNMPWSFDVAFQHAFSVRCVCSLIDNLMSGEEFQGGELEDVCVICLERFVVGTRVARLPCQHIYHGTCIVEWLTMSNLCPLCRSDFSPSLYSGS